MKMSTYAYEKRYSTLKFFKGRSVQFITWICPLMKPNYYEHFAYLFHNGDDIKEMYFLTKGLVQMVIPKFDNVCYIEINPSNHFGLIDFVGSARKYKFDYECWNDNQAKLFRMFTVRARKECEVLYLNLPDLEMMKYEFESDFLDIFSSINERYNNVDALK